ncbi:MAG: sugar-binding protein [Halobacteriota archaeon]
MRKTTISIVFIVAFVLLFALLVDPTPDLPGLSDEPVYVATDGSGDFNCDGSDDQFQINSAMDFVASNSEYRTVHLKSGTYVISDTIFIHNDTILEGEPGTVIKLKDECKWPAEKGLIEPSGRGTNGFTIRDLEVDGNFESQTYIISQMGEPGIHGRGYLDLFLASDGVNGDHSAPYNFEIYNMYFHDGANDGIRIKGDGSDSGMKIHNNTFYRTGHDDIFIMQTKNVHIYNNDFTWLYGDCGVRIEDSSDVVITNNELYTKTSNPRGLSGIYLSLTCSDFTCKNYTIAYNIIKDVQEMGIVVCNRVTGTPSLDRASDLYIHHNLIYDSMGYGSYSGGIQLNGWHNTVIENNVIDGCNGDGIITRNRFEMGETTGYKIYIRNNVISNTAYNIGFSPSGYGINNYLDSRHDFILENNNLWNNEKGNYRNVGSHSTDLNVDPLFVDRGNHDYRLKPNSPIIDAGMGVYGNADPTLDPGNKVTFMKTIGDSGDIFETSGTVSDRPTESLDIIRGTATIDGDLSDWKNIEGITIRGVSDRESQEDNTATIKAMYDDTYLYFGYDVTDTSLWADRSDDDTSLHLDDSVEVYLDTLHNNGTVMHTDDYHFIINLNDAVVDDVGTGGEKDYSYNSNILSSVKLQGSKNDGRDMDKGYIVEVAIPWSDIGGPSSSDIVGLFLAINDVDDVGDVYLSNWCNLTGSYASPEDWGDGIIIR